MRQRLQSKRTTTTRWGHGRVYEVRPARCLPVLGAGPRITRAKRFSASKTTFRSSVRDIALVTTIASLSSCSSVSISTTTTTTTAALQRLLALPHCYAVPLKPLGACAMFNTLLLGELRYWVQGLDSMVRANDKKATNSACITLSWFCQG